MERILETILIIRENFNIQSAFAENFCLFS